MANMTNPRISFIIPTVDRCQELQNCIASIERSYERVVNADIEIVVVFQGLDAKKDVKIRFPQFSYFYHIEKKGLSLARNFGIRKSTGEYLVFLDDDTVINEDFIKVLLREIAATQASAFCCRDTDPLKRKFYSMRFSGIKVKLLNYFEYIYFVGYAHIIKRSSIERIGFYDEKFGIGAQYPAAEESDVFFKLMRLGERIIYLSDLAVHHPVPATTPEFKRFNYAYATGAMLTKQMIFDAKHLPIYFLILCGIILKSFFRTLQTIFFPNNVRASDLIFRHKSVFTGTLKGICAYIRMEGIPHL